MQFHDTELKYFLIKLCNSFATGSVASKHFLVKE